MNSFVEPAIDRLPLAGGEWLEVKHELTAGEHRAMMADCRRRFGPGEMPTLDPVRYAPARILAYVVGWSLTDRDGHPIPFSAGALDSLKVPRFTEILRAVEAHEAAIEEAYEAEKKTIPAGETSSAAGLRSVS
jgi:hypothetical protein